MRTAIASAALLLCLLPAAAACSSTPPAPLTAPAPSQSSSSSAQPSMRMEFEQAYAMYASVAQTAQLLLMAQQHRATPNVDSAGARWTYESQMREDIARVIALRYSSQPPEGLEQAAVKEQVPSPAQRAYPSATPVASLVPSGQHTTLLASPTPSSSPMPTEQHTVPTTSLPSADASSAASTLPSTEAAPTESLSPQPTASTGFTEQAPVPAAAPSSTSTGVTATQAPAEPSPSSKAPAPTAAGPTPSSQATRTFPTVSKAYARTHPGMLTTAQIAALEAISSPARFSREWTAAMLFHLQGAKLLLSSIETASSDQGLKDAAKALAGMYNLLEASV